MTRSHQLAARVFHDCFGPMTRPGHLSHAPGDGWTAQAAALFGRASTLQRAFWHSIALALHGVLCTDNSCLLPKISAQIEKSSNKQRSHCQAAPCCTSTLSSSRKNAATNPHNPPRRRGDQNAGAPAAGRKSERSFEVNP